MSIYSQNKIVHHRDWVDEIWAGEMPSPIYVQLVPTNRCNNRCNFCAYRAHGYSSSEQFNDQSQLRLDTIQTLLDDFRALNVKAVEVTGGGEPLAHPEIAAILTWITDRGMDLGVVTNGSLLTPKVLKALEKATWVRVSIDAGKAETYSATRNVPPSMFAKVRKHVRAIASIDGPTVGVGFVVTKDNWHEVALAACNARDDLADNMRISAIFQDDGVLYFFGWSEDVRCAIAKSKDFNTDTFTVIDNFDARLRDLEQGPPDYQWCGQQFIGPYIGADGMVYRCCILAYNQRGVIGNLNERRFADIWRDPATHKAMTALDARECPRCMYNDKNRNIAYIVNPDPPHRNFV